MSSLLFAELAATCNALGHSDGNKYYIEPYCKETIKDIIRYLRRDDENHQVRRHLGEAKILQSDLLPILKDYWEREDLFEVILRLLVNLTNPALLLYREELPADKTSRNYYLQIISHLQSYKEAFCDRGIWTIFSKKLQSLLQTDSMERESEKGLIIERILILVRNVLQVPADPAAEKRTDNDASIHDQMLWALHTSQMNDLFLYMASSESEQQYYMHILEIVSLMLREQNPAELASAAVTRSTQEKERDEVELLAIRQEEIRRRQEKVKKFTGARHSRFGGTYVLKDMKAVGDNDLIYHKPLNALDSLDFDHDKVKVKRPKNRLPMKEVDIERRSAFCVRLFLKDFCTEFLNGAYNTLMYHVKDGLVRARSQANDESYYMWALKFFMEFNRHHKFEVHLVSETMSVQTFHFVQTQLENCYEHLRLDKKKVLLWSRRMHLALKAYQELLMTLMAMDKSPDASVRESSKVIKSNVFYIVEYRELIVTLMLTFDDIKFSKSYLRDLIETVHVFLKLLEQFCSSRSIMVQKKRTKRRKKSKKSNAASQQTAQARNPEELWDEVGPQLSVVLQGTSEIPDVVPFDAASDQDIDAQKADAMVRIQRLLREHEYEEAVGLLRAAREVWPENDSFGSANMSPEEEFMALHDIFLAELPNANPEQPPAEEEQHEEEEEEDEEEQQVADISYAEQEFNFIAFVRRFMHRKVVHACCLLLRQFDKNLAHTNHCIIKLLHRIVWDCKSPAMIFQASLFRTFQRILDSKVEQHKEMQKFAIFIIRKFVEVAKANGKVYMELLFWKTPQEAYDIEEGYGSYQSNTKAIKLIWSEEEEDELRRLYEEFTNRVNAEGGDATGGDAIDWIMQNMINTDRSRRGVTKKLRELGYNIPKQSGRKSTGTRPPLQWSEEEEQQLRELYEEFKTALDPLGCIIDRLTMRRPKNRIVEKLLELGVVQDKKELRKKRAKKQKSNVSGPSGWDTGGSDVDSDRDSESDDDSGSDGSDGGRPGQTQKKPQGSKKPSANKKKQYSSVDLANVLIQTVAAGMSQALSWLSSCLTEVADDRETDGDEESIPLLPLTEEAFSAMENTDFHRLLNVLEVVPPSDEQERYWRIPGSLSPEDLRKRVEVIEQALDGRLVVENNEGVESTETVQNSTLFLSTSSIVDEQQSTSFSVIDDEDHDKENNSQEIITNEKKKQIEKIKGVKSDSDDYGSTQKTESKKPGKTKRPADKSRRVESDSDDHTDGDINKSSSRKKNKGKTGKKQTKKVIRMDSGSETEEWIQRRNIDDNDDGVSEEISKSRVRNVLSDSETEERSSASQKDKSKKRNVLSDSDSENESLASSKTRKRVLSDSVSDHELTQSKKKIKSQKRNDKNKRKLSDSESDKDLPESRRKDKLSQMKKRKNQRVFDSDDEQSQSANKKDGFSGPVDPMEASESDGEVKRQADLKKRLMALASSDDDE